MPVSEIKQAKLLSDNLQVKIYTKTLGGTMKNKMKLKKTKTRELVIKQLEKSEMPLSASQLFSILESKEITLSSIYRTLNTFLKFNIIKKETDANAVAYYSLIKEEHSHFLVCRFCENKTTLNYCPYHDVNLDLESKYGFKIDEHNVVLYGTCARCK